MKTGIEMQTKTQVLIFLLAIMAIPFNVWGGPPSEDYKLVWEDEFDGTVLDAHSWGAHQLGPRRNAFNTMESVTLDGKGNLLITTSKKFLPETTEKKPKYRYETGMIDTRTRQEFIYGYFECRVKMQKSMGHWSAFWLMPSSMKELDPPDPGQGGVEMDIFEYLCNFKDELKHNFHWNGYKKGKHQSISGPKIIEPGLGEGFHIIGMEWTPDEYVMYCDGKETYRNKKAVSHVVSYVILSCEIGDWAGHIEKHEKNLPDSLYVDYVRVYQKTPGTYIKGGKKQEK